MRQRADRASPFGINLWFEKGEIDEICLQALQDSGALPAEPKAVEIELLIERHFKCPVAYEDLASNILGFTQFGGDGRVQLVAANRSLYEGGERDARRARSTLAHEAGHGLLHSTLFMEGNPDSDLFPEGTFDPNKRRILCRDVDIFGAKAYSGRWWEVQANQAIGGLLLPKRLVQRVIEPFVSRFGLDGAPKLDPAKTSEAVAELAATFDVNSKVAEIRLATMFPRPSGQLEL